VPELITGATRDGGFWSCASVDGGAGTQMKVNRQGPRRGLWTDFSEAEGTDRYSGDMLQLIAVVKFQGWSQSKADAIKWAKSWLKWDDLGNDRSGRKLDEIRREADRRAAAAEEEATREAEKKRTSAWAMWSGAVGIAGTPAEAYLRGRGIDFERLGRIPGSLRYLPNCWCPVRRGQHPAMIASIYLGSDFKGAHRTYLDVSQGKHGPVRVIKVGEPKPKSHKMSLGPYTGGCIVLHKGGRSGSLADMPAGTSVYVSEGIEDGLSVAMADPKLTVVAGVALANMGSLVLPPQAGPLVFIGQNDAIDGKAVEAFERAVAKQQRAAREAGRPMPQLFFPPPQFKDFNDQLMGKVMA
jgi:hypothetical protein